MHLLPLIVSLFLFQAPAQNSNATHRLVVISISGLDARLLNEADRLHVKIPNILKLMRKGASASFVNGVVPSQTWPEHFSLATGVPPSEHGITGNDEGDVPGAKLISGDGARATTLWQAAANTHLKTALVFWPGTVGATAAINFPQFWIGRAGHAVPFEPIAEKSVPAGIVGKVSSSYPSFDKELWDDASSAQASLYVLEKERPDLLMVHMTELDAEQHDTAALSVYARQILENDDDWVGQIVAKAGPGSVIALVSDHGFQNENYLVRPNVLLEQAKVHGKAEVALGLIGAIDAQAADCLRRYAGNRKFGIAREVPIEEVRGRAPELKHWAAAFDTFPDFVASPEMKGPPVGHGTHRGVHGFWASHKDYHSVFVLAGEGVHFRKLGEIDMLEIAPTLADVIGVKLPLAKKPSLWPRVIQ